MPRVGSQAWYHMAKHDKELFAPFVLSERGQKIDKFWFDLRLGNGRSCPAYYSEAERNMVQALTCFRADVIIWEGNIPTVVECKPYAGLACFGQIEGYAELFNDKFGYYPHKLIITDNPRPDLPYLLSKKGIAILYYKPVQDSVIELAENMTLSRIEDLPR